MCGICGMLGLRQDFDTYEHALSVITGMSDSLRHRGPNGSGHWIDMEQKIVLGHRRLSIHDLSQNGKQPMISQSGRYVISFNGEIYNFSEMRTDLESKGVKLKSTCDTEVLLESIACYGFYQAIQKATGMFGVAVYDKDERKLHLARDRFGEKSVYYGWHRGRFLFGSELKAFKTLDFFQPEIDMDSIYLYLKYKYVKAPWSIYKGIYKLLPGQIVTLDLTTKNIYKQTYYNLADVAHECEQNITEASPEECVRELERILTNVISRQLKADVPIGLFLSSGIDSSLTSAIAQKVSNGKLKTYSIGSYDEKANEAETAKAYAHIFGTEHHEYYLNDKECMEILLKIPQIYDEPFAQPSAIPTYIVSKMAKQDVTVVISGDGGDEMFAGYKRDVQCPAMYKYLTCAKPREGKRFSDLYDYLQYAMFRVRGFHDNIVSFSPSAERHFRRFGSKNLLNDLNKALHFEAVTFMESETLVKVDRASMANSLEVREPFLDPEIAEFAFRLPEEYKYHNGSQKWLLKELLAHYLPRDLFDIPKRGFHIPVNQYLLSESFRKLREWAFNEKALSLSGMFNVSFTKERIQQNLTLGEKLPVENISYSILMLQLWLKENKFI